VSTREDLEAALRVRPDDSTLLVYADLLQAQGDPRGELIALDLRPPDQSTNGLETRRGQLLASWLGDEVDVQFDRDAQLWHAGELGATYATFDCGFVDLFVDESTDDAMLAALLHGPAGVYLRRVSLSGSPELLSAMLSHLAAKPRAWLQHLAVSRPHGTSVLLSAQVSDKLVAATPHLEVLDLLGPRLFENFVHPNVRELGITGCESIDLVDGPPFPKLHAIDFAFDGNRPTPRGMFAPSRVPALRRLCYSREEPGARVFEALGTLGVASQLTRLEIPSIRSREDLTLVQAGIDRMPMLRELVIARAYAMFGRREPRHPYARVTVPTPWPWRPREVLEGQLSIDAQVIDPTALVEVLESQYDDLPELERSIWEMFWNRVERLDGEQAFSTQNLLDALAALQLPPQLASLRDHLRERLRAYGAGYYTTIRWVA
jgi:uncharacterized protein (TIGR02996 family)